jgi:hypothetical protein
LSLKSKGQDSAKVADKIISTLDENRDGVITKVYIVNLLVSYNLSQEEWIKHGLETQLVETLLGNEFMELMNRFKIEVK